MATRRDAELGNITESGDSRQNFNGEWPVICDLGDCCNDVRARVRVDPDYTLYLCGQCVALKPFCDAPPSARDWL